MDFRLEFWGKQCNDLKNNHIFYLEFDSLGSALVLSRPICLNFYPSPHVPVLNKHHSNVHIFKIHQKEDIFKKEGNPKTEDALKNEDNSNQ